MNYGVVEVVQDCRFQLAHWHVLLMLISTFTIVFCYIYLFIYFKEKEKSCLEIWLLRRKGKNFPTSGSK